ncbi:MAG: efflux RND transporter periplasmic adaptor subunit [bacterium]|nr:efflux RND transporter periplasmic adaptor subunit [bacterium]
MNKVIKIVAFVIMIVAFVWGGYKLFQNEKKAETEVIKAEEKQDGKTAKTTKTKEAYLPVTVLRIKKGDLPLRLPISATADVWEKTTIIAEVDGVIQKISCTIGGQVPKARELVKLDDSEIKLEVDRARANRLRTFSGYLTAESFGIESESELSAEEKEKTKAVEKKYKKAVADYKNGKISEKEFDAVSDEYQQSLVYSGALRDEIRKAQEGLAEADIQLKQQKLNLKRTSIKSPFPGKISDIFVSKGERVTRGQDILKIVNLQSIYLKGYALESEVKNLKKGTAVRIRFDSFPDRTFYGQIDSISPEIDPENKTISIYVSVGNKDKLIIPGMHADIDVEYKIYKDVLRVPRNAIIVRNRPLLFVVDQEKKMALWEYVELGEKNDEDQIVLKGLNNGLKEGDLVVISGNMTLAHQSKVKILEIIDQK